MCRFLLSAAFLFSGFVKAVDPKGTLFKFQDYMAAFGMPHLFSQGLLTCFVFALIVVEFLLGVYLFFGIKRRFTTSAVTLVMLFFTPFTLYLAIANPVSDCGCFGDAWVLSNWNTFYKNVILLSAAIWLWLCRTRITPFVSAQGSWMISLYSFLFILGVSGYGMRHLPLFDFRPYYVGSYLPDKRHEVAPVYQTTYILEKGGVKREFSEADYPDSSWTFVESKNRVVSEGTSSPLHDLSLVRLSDGEEMADSVLESKKGIFLLLFNHVEEADDRDIDKMNDLYDYACDKGYAFYGVTASGERAIGEWNDRSGAEYPFCQADEVLIKTIVRSNPGLLFIKNGTVLGKWSAGSFPDEEKMENYIQKMERLTPAQIHRHQVLAGWLCIVLLFFVPLLALTGIDRLASRKRRNLTQVKES